LGKEEFPLPEEFLYWAVFVPTGRKPALQSVAEGVWEYRNDRDGYTAAKESFVCEITAKAVEAYAE
jgi:hypothetical protein